MRLNELWTNIIAGNAGISEIEFLQKELESFMSSKKRQLMITGRKYYLGEHDVLDKVRTVIGDDGRPVELTNLPNNKIVYNRFDDLVDQKVNYLLAKPIEVKTDTDIELDDIFNKAFFRQLKNIGKDSLIGGIGYIVPYVDNNELKFKRVKPEQVLPFWKDEEHTELDAFIYFYDLDYYRGKEKIVITNVEYYTKNGVQFFTYKDGKLLRDNKADTYYLNIDGKNYNFNKIPLIAFKANNDEIPLITRVKSLQDALNNLVSQFSDSMEEDVRSTILVIKNYDGTDLSTFRKNLAMYGAVKVRTVDGVAGEVDTLNIEVNSQNYQVLIKLLKDAIVENGRGFDAKDDRMSNNPNMMNIQSMYSDIDLDANEMELEFKASLEDLLYFVKLFKNIKGKSVDGAIDFIFNRDLPINEGEIIDNCQKSEGVISKETIISNHPWVRDTLDEIKRLKGEQAEVMGDYPIRGE